MAELDLSSEISVLRETFASVRQVVDVSRLTAEIEKLKVEASDPNIWDDAAKAQAVTSKLSRSQSQLAKLTDVEARLDDHSRRLRVGVRAEVELRVRHYGDTARIEVPIDRLVRRHHQMQNTRPGSRPPPRTGAWRRTTIGALRCRTRRTCTNLVEQTPTQASRPPGSLRSRAGIVFA
jgi:hypothetical protein